jgi:hypothetical protein
MYSKYLGVDISEYTSMISTETQMSVEGYQYLTNGAKYLPRNERESSGSQKRSNATANWTPAILLALIAALGLGGFLLFTNIQRLQHDEEKPPVVKLPGTTTAPVTTVTEKATPPKMKTPTVPPAPATPEVAPAIPGNSAVPAAVPVSKVATFAASDSELLKQFGPSSYSPRTPAATPSTAPTPAPPIVQETPDVATNADDELSPVERGDHAFLIEAKKTLTVIVRRDGPDGPPVFSGTLYSTAPALRLPLGKYTVQTADFESLRVLRSGQPMRVDSTAVNLE